MLSDIHANLPALETVLRHAEREGAEQLWVLGDIVGYGPDPDAVVRELRTLGCVAVMGNHDAAAVGLITTEEFNPVAAAAAAWTARTIDEETRAFLRSLPQVLEVGDVTLVHGTLREPLWEYLITYEAAEAHFARQRTPLSLVGHTHVPLLLRRKDGEVLVHRPAPGERISLDDTPLCFNPGSVGQPRDGDPRASYAVLDVDEGWVTLHRLEYPIALTQERIRAAGLPEALAARLSLGH